MVFDELAIYSRALGPLEIGQLAARAEPQAASASRASSPSLVVEARAIDDGGAIMSVQLGVNGVFGDPQPFEERYDLRLPAENGAYVVAARLFDRAGNSTTISTTVTLAPPAQPFVRVEDLSDAGATLEIGQGEAAGSSEAQLSFSRDFADAAWQPLPARVPVLWQPGAARRLWLRLRDNSGAPGPAWAIGPDAAQSYLPLLAQ